MAKFVANGGVSVISHNVAEMFRVVTQQFAPRFYPIVGVS